MDLREAVEAAIAEAVEEAQATGGLVVGEFVVIAAAHGWDDEGDSVSQVVVIPDGGGESRILGLVEHARTTLRADVMGFGVDD